LLDARAMRIWVLSVVLWCVGGCSPSITGQDCPEGTVEDPSTGNCGECLTGVPGACPEGHYCRVDGECTPGCETDDDCGGGDVCCDGACVDTSSDPASCGACGRGCDANEGCCDGACTSFVALSDCGACGNVCGDGAFCDGTQCNAPTYPNFCANDSVYVIYDGIAADDHAADVMASTITANCPASVMVRTAPQTDPTLVDQTTGQPLGGGGVTYVLGGGPFPNRPLRWLERTEQLTAIYFEADGVSYHWRRRSDATAVATMPGTACSAHNDQFITELVTDPDSGTLSLVGYGACPGGAGTLAAAWHYANVLLPNRLDYPDTWYVFGWSDTNNNATADAGDTFTVLAHGT
jgi:hypothetical protein